MDAPVISDISIALSSIGEGRVVAFPTGTTYGFAVNALQHQALQRLRALKNRPDEKTFTVFLAESLWDDYFFITEQERQWLQEYKEKPVTVLLAPKSALEHIAQGGKVGLRIIDHPIMEELAERAQVPLTATSANISGRPACCSPACVQSQVAHSANSKSLAAVMDGGTLPEGRVSTIVSLQSDGTVQIVRPGSFTVRKS